MNLQETGDQQENWKSMEVNWDKINGAKVQTEIQVHVWVCAGMFSSFNVDEISWPKQEYSTFWLLGKRQLWLKTIREKVSFCLLGKISFRFTAALINCINNFVEGRSLQRL